MATSFPTKTYRVDKVNNRIVGNIDGAEAYWQFCVKALSTDKETWDYYDENYGLRNMQRYIGKPREYIEAHFPKDVMECVGTDFRTTNVDGFEYEEIMTSRGRALQCKCVIWSIYGAKPFTKEIEM